MHKFANDAADERKREAEERKMLLQQANYRENQAFEKVSNQEQQTLAFMQDMLLKQNDFALKQNDFALKQNDFAAKQNELALQREQQIRADMKELAASEAKVAALQQKLENRDLINVPGDTFIARDRPYFPDNTASHSTPVSVALPRVSTPVSLLTDTTVYHTLPTGAASIHTPLVSLFAARPRAHTFDVTQQQAVDNSTAGNILTQTTGHSAAGLGFAAPNSDEIPAVTTTQGHFGFSAAVTGQMTQPSSTSTVTQSVSCAPTVTTVTSVVPTSVSLPTPISASVVPPMSASVPPPQPLIFVNTPQTVRPYNGSTTWTSFREHFGRVAKVNRWEDDLTKAQHLMLALEGDAAEILKEISDTSPTVLQDIWDALSRRFGEIDEARESMRKFEQRRQSDTESVVEFQQALRSLYRLAWPNASAEQKEVALKTRFEDGLINQEMQQYLRLHATGDTFANTVQKHVVSRPR